MPAGLTDDAVTRFSSMGVAGGAFLAGLLTSAVAYSVYVGGGIYFDESITTTARISLGTGAFMIYAESDPCTNTGGRQTYTSCRVTNPLSTTGAIIRVELDTETAPAARGIICHTTPTSTSTTTGTVITNFSYHTTASGQVVVNSTGAYLLPGNWGIRCWQAAGAPGTNIQQKLRLWMSEYYVP